jgi:hypothetical protein
MFFPVPASLKADRLLHVPSIHFNAYNLRLQSAYTGTFHTVPIAVAERSKVRTVFARSNTAIVGSNPMLFVCVLCVFFLFLQSQVRQPADLIKG